MTLLFTSITFLTLFIPGYALLQLAFPSRSANLKFILAPCASIPILAFTSLVGWMLPEF